MRKKIHAAPAGRMLAALIVVLVPAAGPATAEANDGGQSAEADAALIVPGAGYADPQGSDRVRALQRRLRRADESPGAVDGRFGPLTEAAVRQFQSREGLLVDGLVGPLTRAALEREAALIAPGAGYADRQGSDRVRALQRRLRRADESPGAVDGRFGPLTEAAVRQFQSREGIVADGLVGRSTRVALARTAGPLSNERRTSAAQPDGRRPQPERTDAQRKPRSEPASTRHEARTPTAGHANPDDESPGSMAAVLAAVATLAAGALALGLSGRRRRGGPGANREAVTAPSGPEGHVNDPAQPPRAESAVAGNGHEEQPMLGYAVIPDSEPGVGRVELGRQADAIAGECRQRGLRLLELVRDREPRNGKGLDRPGLGYALNRIEAGEARGLVVSELKQLSGSASELGEVLDWFARSDARLVAAAQELDTGQEDGRLAARALIEVSGWERERLSERTQKGLEAARLGGRFQRRAVADDPELRDRIAEMRAEGMTLQAIADRLNDEGVPTVRGGAMWRPSSVQAAAGYKRPRRPRLASLWDANGQSGKER